MATYTNITQTEIEALLTPQGFRQIEEPRAKELVYGKRIDARGRQLTLRVYTGITTDGESRAAGKDAIRCCALRRYPNGSIRPVTKRAKRVHRVAGWKGNLQKRIDTVTEEATCTR